MTNLTKSLLVLLFVVLAFDFVIEREEVRTGPPQEHFIRIPSTTSASGDVDTLYLNRLYATFNESYFGNKLTKTPKIDMNETEFMASTLCNNGTTDCVIHFNPKYILAPRAAALTMLHEQCHVKTWETTEQGDHGRKWRSCMLQLDAEGAFREIIIDNYRENM